MIVSIHQPVFFMYEGGLEKIRRSDLHVVLAHAQFSPGVFFNRFRLGERWYTMGVPGSLIPLVDMRYSDPARDWARIKRRLPDYAPILDAFDSDIGEPLVTTNMAILRRVMDGLGIKTPVVIDYPTELRGTDRLVDICLRHGATAYLSGPSGPKYMDTGAFLRAGIAVEVHKPTGRRATLELLSEMEFLSDIGNSSHRPLLALALRATEGSPYPVLELGMGGGSTPWLHDYCARLGRPLVSLDGDREWTERFRPYARHPGHVIRHVDWAADWIAGQRWSVALIDHAPRERRHVDVAILRDVCDVLVLHDTEPESSYYPGHVWDLFRYRASINVDGKVAHSAAAAVSNFVDVTRWAGTSFHGWPYKVTTT